MLTDDGSLFPASLVQGSLQGQSLANEPGSGKGRHHGTSRSEPFDRWFRYPAGFASDYVGMLLRRLDLEPSSLILDPFTGSGVTGTSARKMGHSFYGIEAHPTIADLAALKLADAPGVPTELLAAARKLVSRAREVCEAAGEEVFREAELIRRSFDPQILSKLISIRGLIKSGQYDIWTPYLKWALLSTLRDVASVRVGWPYQNPTKQRKARFADPFERFYKRVTWISEDLSGTPSNAGPRQRLEVIHGDSTSASSWAHLKGTPGHGCVSSPPYLNNFDYADATRLELYFWGEVGTWAEMCSTVRSKMITATTQQTKIGTARSARARLNGYGSVAEVIDEIIEKLRNERLSRSRGKEYDRVVPDYFAAIGDVLANLAYNLREGAPALWLVGDSAPYGVYIDTPGIIAALAEKVGFVAEHDATLRRRGQRWATNATRHTVELSERLILLRKA